MSTAEKKGLQRLIPGVFQGRPFMGLLAVIVVLLASNLQAVCFFQALHARQWEKNRAESIAAYYFLLDDMTPSRRSEAVKRMSNVRRSENRFEVVEIQPSLPE
ncbi:MAG: hypothetical protein LBM00_12420 [Deltaproteobacteria bacterium]|jgi:hypothetical protein|nr:hypothetical protein [Deltaproteobacteria bacterium]